MLSARRETCPRVTFSGAGTVTAPARGPEVGMGGEACPHKLGSTNHLRLLLYILIPTVSLLAGLLLLVLALTGIFGSGLLDSSPLPSPEPIADSDPGYHSNSTSPPFFETENVTASLRGDDDITYSASTPAATTSLPPASSSQAPPAQTYTTPPDWLSSVTSLSTSWPISSTAAPDAGSCQLIVEPQCHMLPYNQTWLSSSVAVVKSSEVDMLLRFFSYLSRLSCYRHIMLFGCSLALPECIAADGTHNRRVVLPCASFCEAAREGCEPVLQMFNASWPDFLRCSQFSNVTFASSPPSTPSLPSSPSFPSSSPMATAVPAVPACYTPRQIKGKPSVCGGKDHFLCATGICIPQKLVCNGYNDCDDWSDETHCVCTDGEFRCSTGRCLSPALVCDGYDDCGDLSDELSCVCNAAREHRCGDGRCVSRDWLCDGDHDCLDKSDELNCSCKSQGLLECRNGHCIPSAFRCDGEDDCKDGSDEEQCSREQTQGVCPPGQPSCISTSCPSVCGVGGAACDPRTNNNNNCTRCEPISLELCMNLPYNLTSYPNYLGHLSQRESSVSWESSLFPALVQTGCYQYLMFYACTLLVPKCDPVTLQRVPPCRSLCRNAKEKCESVLGIVGLQWPEDSDCSQFPEEGGNATCLLPEDGVDECSPSHFKCRSGRCVLATKRCDGHLDCDDHSDEDNCGCSERALWECPGSKVCIKASMICDGFPDCPLLVDEANCSVCRDNELSCNNHQCVHRTLWCDGKKHCSDSSDEWNCVSLSDRSGSVLTVFRTAAEYQVCADEWNHELSKLTCNQLGLGVPSSVSMVANHPGVPGRRRWLHVHPEWSQRNGSALQARLEKRSHACHSRRRVSVLCTREECGLRPAVSIHPHRKKRILGGRVSRRGAWPWQCSLQSGQSGHVCGCVLIARRWALTVAHCFEGRESADLWKVVLGLNNLDHPGVHSQSRGVRSIIVHPRYNRAVVDYDISVVQLDSEIEETPFVRPVCLPEPAQLPSPDSYCYITGWGHMGNRMPFKLQEGEVRIISLSQCQSYFDMKTITPRMLCAGYDAGTVDSCMGDSGGPLVCEEDGGHWTLFGLTSWGSVCFSKVLGPGVYSNVTHFTPWIQQQIYIHTHTALYPAKMMDEESTKRYLRTNDDAQTQKQAEAGSKVQAGQEDREITVMPQRKTNELDDAAGTKMAVSDTSSCCLSCIRLKDRCPRPQGLVNLLITKVCLFALLFGVVWSITGSECLPGGNLFGIVILFICSVLGGKLVGMIQLPTLPPFPPLLGMLLAGLVLRNVPYITDAVFIDTHWSAALRNISLSIILTRAGLGLDPSALSRLKAVCLRVAVGPCMVEASIVAIVSHFLLGLPWVWGFILGFVLAAVSPAVVVPSMLLLQREGYGVEKGIPTLLMAAGSFDDILAITGFSTCLGIAFSTGSTWMNILKGLLEVVGGVIAGFILGLFLCCFPSGDQEDLVLRRSLMLLGLSIFSVFFSHVIGFAGAGGLCTLVLAFLAALGWKTNKAPVAAMVGRSWDVFQPLLFGLIGAEITIKNLSPSTVGLGLACISIGLVIRLLVTFLLVHYGGFNLKEKIFIAVAWLPKATVQAAIGSKAYDMAREEGDEPAIKYGLDVLTLAVLAILTTAPIGALGIGLAGPRLLARQVKDDTEGGATTPSSNGIVQEKDNVTHESKL